MTALIEMMFNHLIFSDGVNITVRKGRKWDVIKSPIKGHLASSKAFGPKIPAIFLTSFVTRVFDIPENLLQLEHDPACRSWFGLMSELEYVYPGISKYDEVTIVFFIPEQP